MGSPRDYKTRVSFLHRGLYTANRAHLIGNKVNNKYHLCIAKTRDHRHLLKCRITMPLLKGFKALAKIWFRHHLHGKTPDPRHIHERKRDAKRSLIVYTILFKHIWMSYCAHYKADEPFNCQDVWKRTTKRLRKIIRALDVSLMRGQELKDSPNQKKSRPL